MHFLDLYVAEAYLVSVVSIEAQDFCRKLAKQHYENFPVGLCVPKRLRPHIHAVYAFARTADDFADEAQYEGRRLESLGLWRSMLHEAQEGRAHAPVFEALSETMRRYELPMEWLDDLIKAFESDVRKNRHETFESLLGYSTLSANPVGRIVLWLHGYRDERFFSWSDDICTALQLTNFWQDISVDWKKDRVYLPQSELRTFGYSESDLAQGTVNPAFIAMMRHLIAKTRVLFDRGKPLCDLVSGRLKLELRLIWCGGTKVLKGIEKNGYDVFRRRPKLRTFDYVELAARSTLFWNRK